MASQEENQRLLKTSSFLRSNIDEMDLQFFIVKEKINESIFTYDKSILVFCDCSSSQALKSTIQHTLESKTQYFLLLNIVLDQETEFQRVGELLKKYHDQTLLLTLRLKIAPIQTERYLMDFLELLRDHESLNVNLEILGYASEAKNVENLDRKIINLLKQFYSHTIRLVGVTLWIYSQALNLETEWKELGVLAKKHKTTQANINLLNTNITVDSTAINFFLDNCFSEECAIHFSNNNYNIALEECLLRIVNLENNQKMYFSKKRLLVIRTTLSDIKDVLGMNNVLSEARILHICNEEKSIPLSEDQVFQIFLILNELLPHFKKVCKIYVNFKDIRRINYTGKLLYEEFLYNKRDDYLSFLISRKKRTLLHSTKVFVLGSEDADKQKIISKLFGEFSNTIDNNINLLELTRVFCSCTNAVWKTINYGEYPVYNMADEKKLLNVLDLRIWNLSGKVGFQIFQSLFMTEDGICLVVFNAFQCYKDSELELCKLRNWILSVVTFSKNSSVFLVGSRASTLTVKQIQKVSEALQPLITEFYDIEFIFNVEQNIWFYPFGCRDRNQTNALQSKQIKSRLRSVLFNIDDKHNKYEVELSWLVFMDVMMKEVAVVVSLHYFRRKALSFGFDKDDLPRMLRYFSIRGMILDYSEVLRNEMQLSIVLKPRWFIKCLATSIQAWEDKSDQEMMKISDGSRRLMPLFRENGVLSSTIVRNVLYQFTQNKEEVDFVLKICEKKLIIARLKKPPNGTNLPDRLLKTNMFWFMPCLFSSHLLYEENKLLLKRETGKRKKLRFSFSSEKKPIELPKTIVDKYKQLGKRKDIFCFQKEITWKEYLTHCMFELFIASLISLLENENFCLHGLNKVFLSATLNNINFELSKVNTSFILLNIYSEEIPELMFILQIVREAYEQVILCLKKNLDEYLTPFLSSFELFTEIKQKVNSNIDDYNGYVSFYSSKVENFPKARLIANKLIAMGLNVNTMQQVNESLDQSKRFQVIDKSSILILLIDKEFLSSIQNDESSVYTEMTYINDRYQGLLIPIVLDAKLLDPRPWHRAVLKLKLGSNLYFDFSSRDTEEENIECLKNFLITYIERFYTKKTNEYQQNERQNISQYFVFCSVFFCVLGYFLRGLF